jgi:hypothetical protein
MDGSASGAVAAHDQAGRFTAGNTEYRAKQRRIAERLAQLNADYDASPSQQQLLAIVARHLDDAAVARTAERRVRASNAATRILKQIPRREPQLQSLKELGLE